MKRLVSFLFGLILVSGILGIAEAEERFIIDQSGGFNHWNVIDTQTGLMWLWDVNNVHGYWEQGESVTANATNVGYDNWRQPTVEEFRALFEAIGNPTVVTSQL